MFIVFDEYTMESRVMETIMFGFWGDFLPSTATKDALYALHLTVCTLYSLGYFCSLLIALGGISHHGGA